MKNYKLGNFICKLREELRMDQKTLAALLGVSASAISQCENGGGIKTEKLYQLSELFGVTLDELLDGKRAERSIAEQLEDLYHIDEMEFHQAVANVDYEEISKFFQRIKTVNERFETLIYNCIFAKITTDENTELEYLKRYYKLNLYASKYFTQPIVFLEDRQRYDYIKATLSSAIVGNNRKQIMWELNKIFDFNFDLHLIEILETMKYDDRIETAQSRLKCFATVFDALPSINKDLMFSQFIYNYNEMGFSFKLEPIKTMISHGANLLYSPKITNLTHVDKDINLESECHAERDQKLTDIFRTYQDKCISSLSYNEFARFTYDEYINCIDEDGMRNLAQLANLWQNDKIAYWEKFKTVKFYGKLL